MALPVNIDEVLHGHSVEWERLEFKEGWNPEKVLHTLCAFANDFHNLGGGYLFIGIAENNGRPVLPPAGLDVTALDNIQKEVLNLGFKLQPSYHPIIEPYVVNDRYILVLRAPGGQNRPYKAPESLARENKAYGYYIRKGSSTVRASHQDEVELLSLAAQIPFDDRVNQQASLQALKLPLLQAFLREVGSELAETATQMGFEELCRRMNLVDGPSEALLPRNAGLMFFNEQPEHFFPQTQIDVVVFPEGPGGDTLMEKTFKGPLSRMLQDALLYLNTTVLKEFVVKHADKAKADRFFNYPYAALEEILVNAVYHRSYEIREPIEVRVLPDQITITSYPGPDRSINLQDMSSGKLVARRYRNRRIGEFLKELRLTEGRGTGIPTARRSMRENGSPSPRFETDEERGYFTATLPIHPGAQVADTTQVNTQVSTQASGMELEARAVTLLTFCANPQDRASILLHLGLKSSKNLRERYLHPLVESGLLTMTDPEHPNSPMQKYQTTSKGLELLRHLSEPTG